MDVDPDIDSDAPSIEDSLPLEELNGSKQERAKALRVIRHLLSIGGPSEKKKARENALAGSVNLYKDICSLLSITLPERTNKKARQAAILLAVSTFPSRLPMLALTSFLLRLTPIPRSVNYLNAAYPTQSMTRFLVLTS